MVIGNYREIIDKAELEEKVESLSAEDMSDLTEEQLVGCIAWHFRRDHFIEGSLVSKSIADGHLLQLLKAFRDK